MTRRPLGWYKEKKYEMWRHTVHVPKFYWLLKVLRYMYIIQTFWAGPKFLDLGSGRYILGIRICNPWIKWECAKHIATGTKEEKCLISFQKKRQKFTQKSQYNGNERPAKFYKLFRRKTPLIYTDFIFSILFISITLFLAGRGLRPECSHLSELIICSWQKNPAPLISLNSFLAKVFTPKHLITCTWQKFRTLDIWLPVAGRRSRP